MKYLILSDIHGSLTSLDKALGIYCSHGCDMLLLLGDLLNYGPRNGVPEGLDAMAICESLNSMASDIVAIRGNCDREVDQMLLDFPIMSDCSTVVLQNGKRCFLTHGHIFSPEKLPSTGMDIFFSGHTHLWKLEKDGNCRIICNTGSITFPKGGNLPTFATIEEEGSVCVRSLEDYSILAQI